MDVVLTAGPTATAPALRLRPWRADDAADLAAAFQDPVLRRRARTPIDDTGDALRWIDDQIDGWAAGTRLSFAVLEQPTAAGDAGRPIGNIVIKELSPGKNSAEVGYWTSAQARGRGIAPRALAAVTRWALAPQRSIPLERLDLFHTSDNQASCRVAEKCGFALHAVLTAQPPGLPAEGHLHVRVNQRAALPRPGP